MKTKTIIFAKEFTNSPGGRYWCDGPNSGEEFREIFLIPTITNYDKVELNLNDVIGFPPSFVDEAFRALVDKLGVDCIKDKLFVRLDDDPLTLNEINLIINGLE